MYLTRFRVNTARPSAHRLLASPQRLHAAVMMSFAVQPSPSEDGRVLWRLDRNSPADTVLYIVSRARPDLTHLSEQAGWPTTGGWQVYDYAPLLDRLQPGQEWAFRLTANPVHSYRPSPDEPVKRTAHRTPRHQLRWITDPERQRRAGFAVLEKPPERRLLPEGDEHQVIVHSSRRLTFDKRDKPTDRRRNRTVTLATVTYDGRLRVTDADMLRRTLVTGLGKAKAYGCGLMTLAPVE